MKREGLDVNSEQRREGHSQQTGHEPTKTNTKIKVLLRRLRGWSKPNQREEAIAGDGHQRPLHNVIHNVILRDSPLGTLQGILGDRAAGLTLLAEALNSGLVHHNELLHKSQAPGPQLHSIVVSVCVPLISQ